MFDWKGSYYFGNDFARNIVAFGIDNSSLSHADNKKNNFLVLDEGPTDGINDNTGAVEKSYTQGHNILRIFYVSPNFPFIKSET